MHVFCIFFMFFILKEMAKLTLFDLWVTVVIIVLIDFVRGMFVRYANRCWFWDLETKFVSYPDSWGTYFRQQMVSRFLCNSFEFEVSVVWRADLNVSVLSAWIWRIQVGRKFTAPHQQPSNDLVSKSPDLCTCRRIFVRGLATNQPLAVSISGWGHSFLHFYQRWTW